MKKIIYTSGIPVTREPYTHRLVGYFLAAFARRGYAITLGVPDSAQDLESTLMMDIIRQSAGNLLHLETLRPFSNIPNTRVAPVLFFARPMDYWRYAVRSPVKVGRCKKLLWFQGLESEESFMRHGSLTRRYTLAVAESLAMKFSQVTICPSDAMIDVILRRYPFLSSSRLISIPNLANDIEVPSKDPSIWGFKEPPNFALGYMGGLSAWQCFDETCRIVAEIEKLKPDSWFLVLTPDKELAKSILDRTGVKRYRVRSASTVDAARYIVSFDLGFMLRRDHIVNKVSCPMKWLEYWQCGVPIITTKVVDILSKATASKHNCIIEIGDPIRTSKYIIDWITHYDNDRKLIQSDIMNCVRNDWSWNQAFNAVEDSINYLE